MADFIISPLAISFEGIRDALKTYVANKPDADTWQDFYAAGAGETVIEIAAALGAFYAYQFITGRRESFLSVAKNYTSIIGLAQNLGYSASRGTNLQLTINIVPNQTITLTKYTILGSYTEYDVVLMEDVILNEGVATDITVIIGNFLQQEISVTTSTLTQFTFSDASTTDTCRLLLNDTQLPTSSYMKDALNDYYIMITNVYGSVDVFYLNDGEYNYASGDTLTLQYIERNSLTYSSFSNSNLSIDYASQINEVTLVKDLTDKESAASIKLKAPIYHETSGVIRSRRDYSKYLLEKNSDLIAANDHDIYPGLIEITYLKSDGSYMTEEEKEAWLAEIEEARPSGVAEAIITDPIIVEKSLSISLWKTSSGTISSSISDDIDEILAAYQSSFEIELDLYQIEHDIEQLDGVKIARVELSSDTWTKLTYYNLYDMVEVENDNGSTSIYYVTSFIYKSGSKEPTWPTEIGDTVIDGEIIWEKVNKYSSNVINVWEANTAYDLYDNIRIEEEDGSISVFVCSAYTQATGSSEPSWGNDIVEDNAIIWKLIETTEEVTNTWKANTYITQGYMITENDLIYRCVGFRAKSGSSEPDWDSEDEEFVEDGNLQWDEMDSTTRTVTLDWNQYLNITKTYTIVG